MKNSMKDFAPAHTKKSVANELIKVQQQLHEQKKATAASYTAALQHDPELLRELEQQRAMGLQATDTTAVTQALQHLKK
ncbi:hypothetical protein [Kurthia huakuii]|uniref:hypothetical protein n=1 Tax=Kurthia huakuii TaxID=1421019 RepID=UPI000495422E|nr:hypothetical protein [Kurthia huakuii]MBM7698121.1 hypothetical protein [Kurthia huakuii]